MASSALAPRRASSPSAGKGSLSEVDDAFAPPPFWLVDPRKSVWLVVWDFLVGSALIFTAIVTPWEVSFLSESNIPL